MVSRFLSTELPGFEFTCHSNATTTGGEEKASERCPQGTCRFCLRWMKKLHHCSGVCWGNGLCHCLENNLSLEESVCDKMFPMATNTPWKTFAVGLVFMVIWVDDSSHALRLLPLLCSLPAVRLPRTSPGTQSSPLQGYISTECPKSPVARRW